MAGAVPVGLEPEEFQEALIEMRRLVGAEHVTTADEDLARVRDPYAVADPGVFEPSAMVRPGSVDDVRGLVDIAARFGVPLSPVSTGRNNAYGGAAPRLKGAIVVHLGRMDRILEVDEDLGYALVEPGVSYFALHEYLREHGHRLWVDTADLGWGSVVGNALERGVGFTPYGDHFGNQCGMEVVLADGDVVRTGMGATPGSTSWQVFKYGYGPYVDGLFTQSNFGIVTKMGIWLMPEPEDYQVLMVTVPRESDLNQLVELARPLRMGDVIRNQCTIRHVLFDAATMLPRSRFYSGHGRMPDDVVAAVQQELDLGFWNLYCAFYGSRASIEADIATVTRILSAIPGVRFFRPEDRPGPEGGVLRSREKVMRGEPNLHELALLDWVPAGGHIDFSPVLPLTGADAERQYRMIDNRCREFGENYFSSFIIGRREARHIATFIHDTSSKAARDNVLALCRRLVVDTAEAGYGEYRTHLALMDDVAAGYSWNDGALLRLHERLKDALDPRGILAPGKQGIWPAQLRKAPMT